MIILQTKRLRLRTMYVQDADFILEVLNSPGWLEFIGDRGVDTLSKAEDYLNNRIMPEYEKFGFGFYIMELLVSRIRIGTCGLTRRESLSHPDIGYNLLPKYENLGYAYEAAQAILDYGFEIHKIRHISAITSPINYRSINLLNKLGMKLIKMITLADDTEELMLFGIDKKTI